MLKSNFNLTPSRKRILAQLHDWTLSQASGGLLIGEPGVGKTAIINMFQELFGKEMPVFVVRSTLYNKGINASKNLSDCFERSLDIFVSHNTSQQSKFLRIINNYIEKASTMESEYVITFIDDVTNWSRDHYYWLIDLQNELASRNLKSGFFLAGTVELEYHRHLYMDYPQIQRRFMNDAITISKYELQSV
jgi:hypothetical protein